MSYAGTYFITLPVFTAIARFFNDAELQLWEQFFRPEGPDHYFQVLLTSTPWQQRMRKCMTDCTGSAVYCILWRR